MAGDLSLSFVGAVLTGGASRRMGRDKALIDIAGRSLAVRTAAALTEAGAGRVVCVGGDLVALAAEGLAVVPDDHPGEGPLGGVLTALHLAAPGDLVAVLAVDHARPDAAAVHAVVATLAADPSADLVVPLVEGRRQWLHGAWRAERCGAIVAAAFAAGERSIHRGVAGLRVVDLVGIEAHAVADLDRPEDLPSLRGRQEQR